MNTYLVVSDFFTNDAIIKRFRERGNWKQYDWKSDTVDVALIDKTLYYTTDILRKVKSNIINISNYVQLNDSKSHITLYKKLAKKFPKAVVEKHCLPGKQCFLPFEKIYSLLTSLNVFIEIKYIKFIQLL